MNADTDPGTRDQPEGLTHTEAWWLKCEDGEGDPLLRFAGLAFGLLAVFLLALKLFFPE